MKMSGSSDQGQPRFRKRDQTQKEPESTVVKFFRRDGSQNEKPRCVTCVKRHYGKYLTGTSGFFCCGKDYHKLRNCPTIAARVKRG